MGSDTLTRAIDRAVPLVVLSPHLDDAVLSCAALLTHACDRTPVTIATVFTEGGPPPYTLSARRSLLQARVAHAEVLYKMRRAEDQAVFERLGVPWIHGGLTEALFRRKPRSSLSERSRTRRVLPELDHIYPTYRLHVTSGRVSAQDADTLGRIVEFIETLPHRESRLLVAPLGVGGHVDHVLLRTAVEMYAEAAVYYSDFPYNQRYGVDAAFARRHALIPTTWTARLASKPAMVRAYRTQADNLFPGGRIPLVPEVYMVPRGLAVDRAPAASATG